MRNWLILLGGLIVWAVHFFGLYALAEISPDIAPMLVLVLTALCLAANVWLLLRNRHHPASGSFGAWRQSMARNGAVISLVAVGWQALPALIA